MVSYRLLGPSDYPEVQRLFTLRDSWMAIDGATPVAGTWSLKNYWLNPDMPDWELMGAFDGDKLITTRGSYWCPDVPTVYSAKLMSIQPVKVGQLPSTFTYLFRQMIEQLKRRRYKCFTSLVTPRLSRIYDRSLVSHAPDFDVYITRKIPAGKFTGIEVIDAHLLNMTPAPFETWVRESVYRDTP